jgi:hypothetical protein
MHEDRNGRASWGMPSPGEILLRIESRIGGLETGQRITMDMIENGFERINRTDAEVTGLKVRMSQMERSGRQLEAQADTPSRLAALSSSVKELMPLIAAALWLAAALGAAVDPEVPKALLHIG